MVLNPALPPGRGPGGDDASELRALLRWSSSDGVGAGRLREAVGVVGSARALLERDDAGLLLGRASARPREPAHAQAVLAACAEHGVRAIGWHDPDYPPTLLHLPDPPPVVFARGSLTPAPHVAIVGARNASGYGRRAARSLARELSAHSVVVVSGMALGIDGEAHAGAIEGGGITVAVLGGGVERARPATHRRLYRQILEGGGAVLGEWPPGTPARPFHFPRRNRLLAALTQLIVVVEAGERSGALSTAAHGRRLGREVTAVPGPIDRPGHVGSNQLIRDGCAPILEARDVLDRVGVLPGFAPATPTPHIDPEVAPLWRALEGGPTTLEGLAGRVAMPLPTVLETLTRLEIRGLVGRERGLFVRRVQ